MTATGHAYASFLLGDLNATNVVEDSEVATSGRFYTYAFWVQDDVKLRPNLTLNLGLRYDILKPYTEVYDRWSFMNPDLPNPAVGGYPGAVQFAAPAPTPATAGRRSRPTTARSGRALASPTASMRPPSSVPCTELTIRGAARLVGARARATERARSGFPPTRRFRARTAPTRLTTGTTACRRILPRHSSIRRSTPASSSDALPGGGVTYGDPEIGGRPPRYQNWNAGFQRALTRTITLGASYAGSHGDFLGGAGRGFYANQLDPKYLVLGNLLTQQATPANVAAAQAIVSGIGLPYANFSGTISQMLRPFPHLRRYRRLRKRGVVELPLTPAHGGKTTIGRWLDGRLQLHL